MMKRSKKMQRRRLMFERAEDRRLLAALQILPADTTIGNEGTPAEIQVDEGDELVLVGRVSDLQDVDVQAMTAFLDVPSDFPIDGASSSFAGFTHVSLPPSFPDEPYFTIASTIPSDTAVDIDGPTDVFRFRVNAPNDPGRYSIGFYTAETDLVTSYTPLDAQDSIPFDRLIPLNIVVGQLSSSFAVAASATSVAEGNAGVTNVQFDVTRSGDTSTAATIQYQLGGQIDANDISGGVLSGEVSFEAGQTTRSIIVPITGDTDVESNENLVVTISGAPTGSTIQTDSATSTITNDDVAVVPIEFSITATNADRPEGNSASTPFTFSLSRTGANGSEASIEYEIAGQVDASDIQGGTLNGTANFAAGASTTQITVNVVGDTNVEPDESFAVTLRNPPSGTSIDTGSASGVIRNDDTAVVSPVVSIAAQDADRTEGDSGTSNFLFTISRSGDLSTATTVNYTVSGVGSNAATASDFVDGVFPSGSITLNPSQSTETLSIAVAGDLIEEPTESFAVTLTGASGNAQIATSSATGQIRNDDVAPVASYSIEPVSSIQNEIDAGTQDFVFRVTRSVVTTGSSSVDFTVMGVGANPANEDDFGGSFPTGTIMFADGQATQEIRIEVSGDNTVESNESFRVTLANPTGDGVLGQATATGTILDNDRPDIDTRILSPGLFVPVIAIPGDNVPTAFIFRAVVDTTVRVIPIGSASVTPTVRILDDNAMPIGSASGGGATAEVIGGTLNAITFQGQSTPQFYAIRTDHGFDALTSAVETNLFEPTDTNGDGNTTPADALVVLNQMRRESVTSRSAEGEDSGIAIRSTPMADVNADGKTSAIDALLIVNKLRRDHLIGRGEGELISRPIDERENPFATPRVARFDRADRIGDLDQTRESNLGLDTSNREWPSLQLVSVFGESNADTVMTENHHWRLDALFEELRNDFDY